MVEIDVGHNEARLEATRALLDSGPAGARIRIYPAPRRANIGAAAGVSLLAEIALSEPCGVVASNKLTLASTDEPVVLASGIAAWATIVDGNGVSRIDCDAGDMASSAEVKLSSAGLIAGSTVSLASGVIE